MKCPRCGGSGKYMREVGGYRPCEYCNGTGKIVQTNDEWRRTCSTEDFAKWLTEVTDCCFECGLNINNDVLCLFGKCIDNEYDAVKWLKEKHE